MPEATVNASIQLVPLDKPGNAIPIIDEAIALIKASGLACEVGPFGTSVEGTLPEVLNLVNGINTAMQQQDAEEWLINLQVHVRKGASVSANEKTAKHRR
jgi:uncharacterized protein YqgV (UPF0045/DUF77 family)